MSSTRKISLAAGVLFIITFITSIPALYLFQPVLDDPAGYIAGSGGDNTRIFVGALLELLLIIANVASAVVLFPILKRQNEMLALGYVTARLVESTFIAIGLVSVLGVVSLQQQDPTAADAGAIGVALAAIKDWTFLLGPGFVVGVGNGLLLGYLMYTSGLVPRRMAILGLVGGPLICASGALVLLGVFDEGGTAQAIATIPEFVWELSLGIWLTVRGFNPSPILSGMRARSRRRPDRSRSGSPDLAWKCDAPGTIRTCDTQIRSLLLYPLSYGRGRNGSAEG